MIDDLYTASILRLAANMPRAGRLDAPDASSEKVSRLCGSRVLVDLRLEGDRVADFAQEVKACALGQAAAAVLGEHVLGARVDEIESARDQLAAMLKAGGAWPRAQAFTSWAKSATRSPSTVTSTSTRLPQSLDTFSEDPWGAANMPRAGRLAARASTLAL